VVGNKQRLSASRSGGATPVLTERSHTIGLQPQIIIIIIIIIITKLIS